VIVFDLFSHVGLISIAVWVVYGEDWADWIIITSVVGQVSKSFAMILRRHIEFFYCWLFLVTIFLSGCSSIKKNHRGVNRFFSARSVLKSWRRKAQEQSARLFHTLPQNPEVFYTPVNKIYYVPYVFQFLIWDHKISAGSDQKPGLPSRGSSHHYKWRVLKFCLTYLFEWLLLTKCMSTFNQVHFGNSPHSSPIVWRTQKSGFPSARGPWVFRHLGRQSFQALPP
jgi:hypothetical protein